MRKALILGTNETQADIISYLKETGWEVHACGYKRIGAGCDLAHFFHLVNTTDIEAVKTLAKKIKADIVYSVSSDTNIKSATKVSEEIGLPVILGSDIIDLFHYKEELRQFLNRNNISVVAYKKVSSIKEIDQWNNFPCVVKPSDSQGQRGVQLIYREADLKKAVQLALNQSKSSKVIIEEFLDGPELSTNMVIQSGKIVINEFSDRLVFDNNHFGLPKGHSIPVKSVSKENLEEAIQMTENLVKKLALNNAILYIQMKITKTGAKIIEIAPRLDGCHIWRLIKYAKGYDIREYTINCLLGNEIKHNIKSVNQKDKYTLKFHHLKTNEKFESRKLNQIDNFLYNSYRYVEGGEIQPINGSLEVVGYYIYKD